MALNLSPPILSPAPSSSPDPLHDSPTLPGDAPPEAGPTLLLLHPEQRSPLPQVSVRIGAPGLYPFVQARSLEDGRLLLPVVGASLYTQERLETYVVQASFMQQGRQLGIWRDVIIEDEHLSGAPLPIILVDAQPLSLRVRSPEGQEVAGARVRVRRSSVDLVALEASGDAHGMVAFEALPAGEYVAVIGAPGYLTQEVTLAHELAQSDQDLFTHDVPMQRGRNIYGRVVNERGEGVPEAFITAHVERWGEPRVLPVESLSHINAIPARGMAIADMDGYFSIDGLPLGIAYLMAQASTGMPSLSLPIDLRDTQEVGPVSLTLEAGALVEVQVLGDEDQPVKGAQVSWKDGPSGLTSREVTDAQGLARFEDVSGGAKFIATARTWSSPRVVLQEPEWDGVHRLTLRLRAPGAPDGFRFRLEHPERVAITGMRYESELQERCEVQRLDANDWSVQGCQQGRGTLWISTREHGLTSMSETFEDLQTLRLPEPSPVSLTLSGWPGGIAPEQHLMHWQAGEEALLTPITLTPINRRRTALRWRGELYPQTYAFSLTTAAGETLERSLKVKTQGADLQWELTRPEAHDFFVVDHRDHPITGAHVEVWVGGGRVLETTSRGREPVTARAPALEGARIYMLDDVRAGSARLTAQDLEATRHVVSMDRELFGALGRPGEITDPQELGALLGAPLVRDHERWRIDARASTAAAQAGIPRGAAFVGARKSSQGVEVLYRTHPRANVESAVILSP